MKKTLMTALCVTLLGIGMAQEHHWIPNQTFENTMDGIGIVIIDGEEQFTDAIELGIFCGDDCRGSFFAEDEGDHWFYYFSMGGVSGETFTFRLFDHSIQEELDVTCTNEAVPFEINGFLGDWDEPFEIAFTSNSMPTFSLNITGYGNSAGGYYLIAPPVASVTPSTENGFLTAEYDLYHFDQSESGEEWQNYEVSPFDLVSGKGYLYASKTNTTLTFTGLPYTGDGAVALDYTAGTPWSGWNLVGNPYGTTATLDRDFYAMKADGTEIIASNTNSVNAMQGIFVIADGEGEMVTFTPENSVDDGPRIVIDVMQGRGASKNSATVDRAIVRFGEGGRLPKFMLNPDNTKLYIPAEDGDYAVVRCNGGNEMPVSFKASEDGMYTLKVEKENVEMGYLHLVDNKTGDDIDLLHSPSYSFEACTTDYADRFKLVFAYSSVCEDADGDDVPFAFVDKGNIVVTGEGALQVTDAMGRIVVTADGRTRCVPTAGMASGVYVLRLINDDETRVQKIVVK